MSYLSAPEHSCLHFSALLPLNSSTLPHYHLCNSPPDAPSRPPSFSQPIQPPPLACRALLGQVAITGALHTAQQHVDWDLDILRHSIHASSHGVLVPPTSLPRSLARSSLTSSTHPDHTPSTRPSQAPSITLPDPTTTPARFPSKTPKGVDNYDNPIENIECSDEIYPRAT